MSTVWLPSLLPGYTLKNPGILRKTCENLWKPDKLISCHCGWVTWPLCTKPHRELFGSLKAWSIHQHHCCLLQRSAALKFALLAKSIDFLFAILFCQDESWMTENQHQLASQSTTTHFGSWWFRPVSAAFSQQKVASRIYSACPAMKSTKRPTPFVLNLY